MSAFPKMKVKTYEQADAKRTTNFAAAHVDHSGAAVIPRSHLRDLERDVERRLRGVSPGRVRAKVTKRGNVIIEHKHQSTEGWGGNEPVTTHISAHPTHRGMRDSAIGSHHARTEDAARELLAQARIVGHVHKGVPNFTEVRTVVGHGLPPGYANGNIAVPVVKAMAEGYTEFARAHPSAMALGGAGGAGPRHIHAAAAGHGPGGGAGPRRGASPARHGHAAGHGPGGGAGPRRGASPARHGHAAGHGPGGGAGPRRRASPARHGHAAGHGPGGGAGTRGRPGGGRRKRYTRKN